MYAGELVFTWLYDAGGEIRLHHVEKLVPAARAERIEPGKSAPSYLEFVRPLAYRYPTRKALTDQGEIAIAVEARVYAIGAVGVTLRIPFEVPTLELVNELTYARPVDGSRLSDVAREVSEELLALIRPALVETYKASVEPETYLVVALTRTERTASELFQDERQILAGIVAGERRPERLSGYEVMDNLRSWYKYYEDDLVIIDWDRTLVIEPSGKVDDVLSVIDAANLELLELRVYDQYLDDVLEGAYEDLTRFYGRGGLFRSARGVQEELSNARIDLVRVTDSINNIGKIFGDYYLAKLHVGLAERFHLPEWESIVREKMQTLGELYTLASHEVEHRRGMLLEASIVALFVIDIVIVVLTLR